MPCQISCNITINSNEDNIKKILNYLTEIIIYTCDPDASENKSNYVISKDNMICFQPNGYYIREPKKNSITFGTDWITNNFTEKVDYINKMNLKDIENNCSLYNHDDLSYSYTYTSNRNNKIIEINITENVYIEFSYYYKKNDEIIKFNNKDNENFIFNCINKLDDEDIYKLYEYNLGYKFKGILDKFFSNLNISFFNEYDEDLNFDEDIFNDSIIFKDIFKFDLIMDNNDDIYLWENCEEYEKEQKEKLEGRNLNEDKNESEEKPKPKIRYGRRNKINII